MASPQNMKWIKIQNREKVIYYPTYCISRVEYEENDDRPKYLEIPETKANNYSTGYEKDADIDEEENY